MPYKDKEAQRKAQARYFQENKKAIRRSQNQKRNAMRRRIQEIKESSPCADCGIQYPYYMLDFDHVRGEKLFNVASTAMAASMGALEAEIAKCEVVCANCHRHRTFLRKTLDVKQQEIRP